MVESVDDEGDNEGESRGVRCLCRDDLTRASSEIQIGQPAQPGESLYDLDTCLEYSSIECHEDSGPFYKLSRKIDTIGTWLKASAKIPPRGSDSPRRSRNLNATMQGKQRVESETEFWHVTFFHPSSE